MVPSISPASLRVQGTNKATNGCNVCQQVSWGRAESYSGRSSGGVVVVWWWCCGVVVVLWWCSGGVVVV